MGSSAFAARGTRAGFHHDRVASLVEYASRGALVFRFLKRHDVCIEPVRDGAHRGVGALMLPHHGSHLDFHEGNLPLSHCRSVPHLLTSDEPDGSFWVGAFKC
jgi:hypothetical protein